MSLFSSAKVGGLWQLTELGTAPVAQLPLLNRRSERLTGEPCAGEPHARFGGRGVRLDRTSLPLSLEIRLGQCQITQPRRGEAHLIIGIRSARRIDGRNFLPAVRPSFAG